MVREAADKKLYDAATNGDVATFKKVLHEDPHLLDEVSFARSRNLLHIATMHGQMSIVEEVLGMNSELARDVDSKNLSSLHIAATQGQLEIVKTLLSAAPEMCWWVDDQGMNPVHIAAMKGHVEILKELLQLDSFPAMERLHRGQTVMHLCVKHRQLETLKVLVDKLGELVCAKDDDGETILHLAARCNQLEITGYLVESNKIEKQSKNSMGKTALDILKESPHTESQSEIRRILSSDNDETLFEFSKISDQVIVVMVLVATMAFQATVSPPGGVQQNNTSSHKAGDAVMASTHPIIYEQLVIANTGAFVSSLVTICLLTIPVKVKRKGFVVMAMWSSLGMSLTSIALSYAYSVLVTAPNTEIRSFKKLVVIVLAAHFTAGGIILGWFGDCLPCKSMKRRQEDSRTTDP